MARYQFKSNISRLRLTQLERRVAPASFNTLVSRADITSVGDTGGGKLDSEYSTSISADGRYSVFASSAQNLIAGQIDSNSATDIFLYDRTNNTTELISHAFGMPTTAANGYSHDTTLSTDGRYVVFRSSAT